MLYWYSRGLLPVCAMMYMICTQQPLVKARGKHQASEHGEGWRWAAERLCNNQVLHAKDSWRRHVDRTILPALLAALVCLCRTPARNCESLTPSICCVPSGIVHR